MSFNLRTHASKDGKNSFDGRKERVRKTVIYEKPDAMGFREADGAMTERLKTARSYAVSD